MNKKTKTILAVVVLAGVGLFLYNRKKAGKSLNPFKSFDGEDDEFFNAIGRRKVVGGYDSANNRTWIFNEGSRGKGYWVTGRVNVPTGTTFN